MRFSALSAMALAAALFTQPASAAVDAGGSAAAIAATTPGDIAAPLPMPRPPEPRVVARISIATQTMVVEVDGKVEHSWRVSTARAGKVTPRGTFGPQFLSPRHFSSLYNNAPMPYAVFFNGHIAVHGTTEVARLGRPASAGCVRLHTENARAFFRLVQQSGRQNVRIIVS